MIGNAIKFTDAVDVAVAVEQLARGAGGAELQVSVTDTGVGIPADRQAAIFEVITQASTDLTRQARGHGSGCSTSSVNWCLISIS
jgi:signal transduction histidine kinase